TVDFHKPVDWLKAYVLEGNLRLPSGVSDYGSTDEVIHGIRSHIHKYFECDPLFEAVAAVFALHTWVYERFQAVPYLRLIGLPQSGKSRALGAIGSVCYHPNVIAGSITSAALFRTIAVIGGTTVLDEADPDKTEVGADLMKILNCGYQKGLSIV